MDPKTLLARAKKEGLVGFLTKVGSATSFAAKIEQRLSDHELVLSNCVPIDKITEFTRQGTFYLQIEQFRYQCDELSPCGGGILFTIQSVDSVSNTRDEVRKSYAHDDQAIVRLKNPFDNETVLEKKLFDLSSSGFSITISGESLVFREGISFKEIEILYEGDAVRKCQGKVVYQKPYIGFDGQRHSQIGFQLI